MAKKKPVMSKEERSRRNLLVLNRAEEEMAADQELELAADYDEAYEEWKTKDKPYLVKFLGQVFKVPRTQPFAYALFISKHTKRSYSKQQKKEITELVIPEHKGEEYIKLMLGEAFVEALGESDVSLNYVMERIAPDIHRMWQGIKMPTDLKNAQTPGS